MKPRWTSFGLRWLGLSPLGAVSWAGLLVLLCAGSAFGQPASAPSGRASGSGQAPASPFQRARNPAAAGLWIGQITLGAVTYAATGAVEPTQSPAQMRLILHVDGTGQVRLLKDVIVAAKAEPASDDGPLPFTMVIVTKPALLARSGLDSSIKGQRFSTVAFDFTDNDTDTADAALNLAGGLGQNYECAGTLLLDKLHPTNPFRHKFHPDHANDGARAYVITRSILLQFSAPIQNVAGVDHLDGAYREVITGLHRSSLTAQGTVQLTRVAATAVLNQ